MTERRVERDAVESTAAGTGDELRMGNLLDRWEEAQERGQPCDLESLCADCPELLDALRLKIEALEAFDERLRADAIALQATDDGSKPATGDLIASQTRYSQRRLLAQGGLGVVYSATDESLGREVAIKFMQPRLRHDPHSRSQFQLEAQVAGRLEHPGVVPLYGVGRTPGGDPFYVMRYIAGENLGDAVQRFHDEEDRQGVRFTSRRFHELLGHFVGACKTIAYAHDRGVLHRDIKPANIMLGRFGETMVVDWGLALPIQRSEQARAVGEPSLVPATERSDVACSSGSGAGTPAYMSPEQAEGCDHLTPASDIFSLGTTLYWMLSRMPPFDGANVHEVLQAVRRGQYRRLNEVNRRIPKALQAICGRAMQLKPSDRYPSALDLARDVECWLADAPVSAMPDSPMRIAGRWLRHHRATAQVLAISGVLLILISSIAAITMARLAKQEHQALEASQQARRESIAMAAQFAARSIAGEIDVRWRILETEAADGELARMLADRAGNLDGPVDLEEELDLNAVSDASFQAWLNSRYIEHNETTRATSWLLCDHRGVQLARAPVADTIGQRFAFRDYFHGLGSDLNPGEAEGAEPITNVHRSMVFHSQAINRDMVAFSVPVWSGKTGTPRRRVLGVLAMTVEVGEFQVLESTLSQNQTTVLIDTRVDLIDGKPLRGRILQHPRFGEELRSGGPKFRISPDDVERCVDFIRRRHESKTAEHGTPQLRPYHDPLAPPQTSATLAAFEPVTVRGRDPDVADTGWYVIVQSVPD